MKTDAPPLLQAGLHHITTHALKKVAVDAFPTDVRRHLLFSKFLAWRDDLRKLGFSGKVWLDGSFMTEKVAPDDIDLIFWTPQTSKTLSPQEKIIVKSLFDRANCRATFNLDLYCESPLPNQLLHRQAYWRGLFGFAHDGQTAKGIAEVVV